MSIAGKSPMPSLKPTGSLLQDSSSYETNNPVANPGFDLPQGNQPYNQIPSPPTQQIYNSGV